MSNTMFKIKNNKVNTLSAKLLYATKAKYEDDWHSTMHMHPFTELFYVVSGKGSFRVEDIKFGVFEDDLVIVNSNVSHTESSKGSNPLEYIVLGIDGLSITVDDKSNMGRQELYSKHNYRAYKNEILLFINNIISEVQTKGEHYEAICQNLLEILILNILRRTKTNLVLTSTKNINKECAYIKKYIDVHYASNITLDSLASVAYMNKYYLVREFKKYIGKSPIEYLIDKRIDVSKILLETTDHTMEQISEIVGFSSQSYFNQIFKKKLGITPTQYKKSSLI